jgi:DNA adenine methylase
MKNRSPLRYPGGKTRACKPLNEILDKYFNMKNYKSIVSPFFGGGSFEFHIQNKYDLHIIANDKFEPLYNFWNICLTNKEDLCNKLYKYIDTINKEIFTNFRKQIRDSTGVELNRAIIYFIINRCSFSGSTLSGGFSLESSKKRFTVSSIDRINQLNLSNFEISNHDFENFINKHNNENNFIFLDPPYYLEEKSKLYGNNGDMHEKFDHNKLFNCISTKTNWLMTYNNCEFIKQLYKDFSIIETSWSYGMNKSKESSEIVIIG